MHPFDALAADVIGCTRCPRLVTYCRRVGDQKRRAFRDQDYWAKPIPSFGDHDARLMIIGLAPAAHGANRTGRMFTGDRSGEWLYRALHKAGFANRPASENRDDGLALNSAYITAAAHCAPPDNKPTTEELYACRPYLVSEMSHLLERAGAHGDRLVILALGGIAFSAALRCLDEFGLIVPSPKPKFSHLAEYSLSDACTLLGSYHPSQQNTQTGRLSLSMFDDVFRRARRLVDEA